MINFKDGTKEWKEADHYYRERKGWKQMKKVKYYEPKEEK